MTDFSEGAEQAISQGERSSRKDLAQKFARLT